MEAYIEEQIIDAIQIGTFGATSVAGLLSSVSCMHYLHFKMKLNKYIKIILSSMLGANVVAGTTCGIISFSMSVQYGKSETSCYLAFYPGMAITGYSPMAAMISGLRYYMASLASKTKLAKAKVVVPIIICGTLVSYGAAPIVAAISDFRQQTSLITTCMEIEALNDMAFPVQKVAIAVFSIVAPIVGVCYDIAMYFFLKKRATQQAGPSSALVPWKSTSEQSTDNDFSIPIRATMISSATFFFSVVFYPIIMFLIDGDSRHFMSIVGLFSAYGVPILLTLFAVKNKEKIVNAQPPKKLHFHEGKGTKSDHMSKLHFHDNDDDHVFETGEQRDVPSVSSPENSIETQRATFILQRVNEDHPLAVELHV